MEQGKIKIKKVHFAQYLVHVFVYVKYNFTIIDFIVSQTVGCSNKSSVNF